MEGDQKLDGNAVAGVLGEIFAAEMTLTEGTCASCGKVAQLAEVEVYMSAPGAVLRCAACGQVLMKVVRGRDRVWLELAGTRRLQFAVAAS